MSIDIRGYHDARIEFYDLGEDGYLESTTYPKKNTLYFGAEVETDDPNGDYNLDDEDDPDSERSPAWNTDELERDLNRIDFFEYFTPTHDGSLENGAEFVSDAFTLDAWHHIQDVVSKGFRHLRDSGLRAHDTTTCGLHVHVSRNFFTSEFALSNLVIFVERNWNDLTVFARRKESSYARRPLNTGTCSIDKKDFDSYIVKQDGKLYEKMGRERYAAVNLRNTETIEFRFFRGTLNPETFYATLQFISNLIHLMNEITMLQACTTDIYDIFKYQEYPELKAYALKRKFGLNEEATSSTFKE